MPPFNLADEPAPVVAAPSGGGAGGAPSVVGTPAGTPDFSSMTPADQAAQLKKVYDPALAKEFFAKPENVGLEPEVDAQYFSDKNNIGDNPEADDKFFSGSYDDKNAKATSRENFDTHKESASKYLTDKFKGPYTVGELAKDFFFDPGDPEKGGGSIVNNGKTIKFDQYKEDQKIKSIETTPDGFLIVRENEGITHDIQIKGTAENEIVYDPKSGQLSFKSPDGKVQDFTIRSEDQKNVEFNLKKDGTIEVLGPVKGSAIVNERLVEFNNHVGKLVLSSNGDISAENAEVITPRIYADGHFTKKGDEIEARAHGDINRGNLNPKDGQTVILDRTTNVGVKTQGQVEKNKVKIHLDKFSPDSEFAPKPEPQPTAAETAVAKNIATPEEKAAVTAETAAKRQVEAEQARQSARNLKLAKGDLGENAEVWIKKDKNNQVVVTAKGKVNVGKYHYKGTSLPPALDNYEPQFTGKNGKSEFDANLGVTAVVNVRGQANYQDRQYSKIDSQQDGSSMKITRDGGNEKDVIVANCFLCSKGKVMDISKNVYLTDPSTGISDSINSRQLNIEVKMEENEMSYSYSTASLGKLAELQTGGSKVAIGRDLLMKVPCGDKECNLQFAKDENNNLIGHYEHYDLETKQVSAPVKIDLNVGEVLGNPTIVTSEKNIEELEKLEALIASGKGKVKNLAGLKFDKDPQLRAHLLKKYGLDVSLLGNEKYLEKVVKAVNYREKADKYLQRLRDEGIEIDDNGQPLTTEAAEAINKLTKGKGKKLWWYTAAMMQVNKAKIAEVQAIRSSCVEGESCQLSPEEAKKQEKNLKKEVNKFSKIRKVLIEEDRVKKVKRDIKNGVVPETAQIDFQRAKELKGDREGVRIEIWEKENEINRIDEQIKILEKKGNSEALEEIYQLEEEREKQDMDLLSLKDEKIKLDSEVGKIVASYTKNRPDLAVDLALESGRTGLANNINRDILVHYDQDAAQSKITGINEQVQVQNEDLIWEAGYSAHEATINALITKSRIGLVPQGGQEARIEVTRKRDDMLTTTREIERNAQELVLIKKELMVIAKKSEDKKTTPADKIAFNALMARMDSIKKNKEQAEKKHVTLQNEIIKTITPFIRDRPDFARDLALDSGDLGLAKHLNDVYLWNYDPEGATDKGLEIDMLESMEIGEAYGAAGVQFKKANAEIYNDALIKEVQLRIDNGDTTGAAKAAKELKGADNEKAQKALVKANNLLWAEVGKETAAKTRQFESAYLAKKQEHLRDYEEGSTFGSYFGFFAEGAKELVQDVFADEESNRDIALTQIKTKKVEADLIDVALTSLRVNHPDWTPQEAITYINAGKFTEDDILPNFKKSRKWDIKLYMHDSTDQDGNPIKRLTVSHHTAFLNTLQKRYSGQELNLEDKAYNTLEAGELQRVFSGASGGDTAETFKRMDTQIDLSRYTEISRSGDNEAKWSALLTTTNRHEGRTVEMTKERANREENAWKGGDYLDKTGIFLSEGSRTISAINLAKGVTTVVDNFKEIGVTTGMIESYVKSDMKTVNEVYEEMKTRTVSQLRETSEEATMMNVALNNFHGKTNPRTGNAYTPEEAINVISTGWIDPDNGVALDRTTFLAGVKDKNEKERLGKMYDRNFGSDRRMIINKNGGFLGALDSAARGESISGDTLANLKIEQLQQQITAADDKSFEFEQELAALAQENKWGTAGRIAGGKVEELDQKMDNPLIDWTGLDLRITNRMGQQYGDVGIETATLIDIPGAGLLFKASVGGVKLLKGTKTAQKVITGVKESAVVQKIASVSVKAKTAVQTTIFASKQTKQLLSGLKAELRTADFLGDVTRVEILTDRIADTQKVLIAEAKVGAQAGKLGKLKSYLHNDAATRAIEKGKVLGMQELKGLNQELAAAKASGSSKSALKITEQIAEMTKDLDDIDKIQKATKLAGKQRGAVGTWLKKERYANKKLQTAADELVKAQVAFRSSSGAEKLEKASALIKASEGMKATEEAITFTGRVSNRLKARSSAKKIDDLAAEGIAVGVSSKQGAHINWDAINAVEDVAKREKLTKKAQSLEKSLTNTDVRARVFNKLKVDEGVKFNTADNVNDGMVFSGGSGFSLVDEEVETITKGLDELADGGAKVRVREGKIEFENVHPTQKKKAAELKQKIDNSGIDLAAEEAKFNREEVMALGKAEGELADAQRVKKGLKEQHNPDLVHPENLPEVTPSSVADNVPSGSVENNVNQAVSGVADADQPVTLSSKNSNVKWDPNVERWRDSNGKFAKVEVDDAYKWNAKTKNYEYSTGAKKGQPASFDEVTDAINTNIASKTSPSVVADGSKVPSKSVKEVIDGVEGKDVIVQSKRGNVYKGRAVSVEDDILILIDDAGKDIAVKLDNIVVDNIKVSNEGVWDDIIVNDKELQEVLGSGGARVADQTNPNLFKAKEAKRKVVEDLAEFKKLSKELSGDKGLTTTELNRLDDLRNQFISPADELLDHKRLTGISKPTEAQLKELEVLMDRITFRESIANTDPTEINVIIGDLLNTGELGHSNIDEMAKAASSQERMKIVSDRADEVIRKYATGFEAQTGTHIRASPEQVKYMREHLAIQMEMLTKLDESGYIDRIAKARGITKEEAMLQFQTKIADSLQKGIIHDGLLITDGVGGKSGQIRIGTGVARLRESNGYDHIIAVQLRAREALNAQMKVVDLQPEHFMEIYEAVAYHDMAKGSLWNNAGGMAEAKIAGSSLSDTHVIAAGKYVEADKTKLVALYGEEGYKRILTLATHHDDEHFLRISKNSIFEAQWNAITAADNTAGASVRSIDGTKIFQDKLVEALNVEGNQEILSLALRIDEGKGAGLIDKTKTIESLKQRAIDNIFVAAEKGDIGWEQGEMAIRAMEDDFSGMAARFMRRTQPAGEMKIGISDDGIIIFEQSLSTAAGKIDDVHSGSVYQSQKGLTDVYWDEVTIRPKGQKVSFDGDCDSCRVFEIEEGKSGVVFEIGKDGSRNPIKVKKKALDKKGNPVFNKDGSNKMVDVDLTRKEFTKKYLPDELEKTSSELHKARGKGTHLENKIDGSTSPGTFTSTDDYALEIHFKGEETAASIPQEEFLAAGTKTKKDLEKVESIIEKQKSTFDKAKNVVDKNSKAPISEAQFDEIVKTIDKPEYDDFIETMRSQGLTEEDAVAMVDLIEEDFAFQQYKKYFKVNANSPLDEAIDVVKIEGVSSTVKLKPVDEIEEFMALSEKVADGRATTEEIVKLKELEKNVQVYGDEMGEYLQLQKVIDPSDAQVKKLNQLGDVIAQRELERIEDLKSSFEEAIKIANQGNSKLIDAEDIDLIIAQINDFEGVTIKSLTDRAEAIIELKKFKEIHLIHEIERIHTLGIMKNSLLKNVVKSSYGKFSQASSISSAESVGVSDLEELTNTKQAAASS